MKPVWVDRPMYRPRLLVTWDMIYWAAKLKLMDVWPVAWILGTVRVERVQMWERGDLDDDPPPQDQP